MYTQFFIRFDLGGGGGDLRVAFNKIAFNFFSIVSKDFVNK